MFECIMVCVCVIMCVLDVYNGVCVCVIMCVLDVSCVCVFEKVNEREWVGWGNEGVGGGGGRGGGEESACICRIGVFEKIDRFCVPFVFCCFWFPLTVDSPPVQMSLNWKLVLLSCFDSAIMGELSVCSLQLLQTNNSCLWIYHDMRFTL